MQKLLTLFAACFFLAGNAAQATEDILDGADISSSTTAGSIFRDCAECPEMVVIPSGNFIMGNETTPAYDISEQPPHTRTTTMDNRSGRFNMDNETIAAIYGVSERPAHAITIPDNLAVGRFEVTVGEFRSFVEEAGYEPEGGCLIWRGRSWDNQSRRSWQNPGFRQSDQYPVACVNWADAQAYVSWLSMETGQTYRLLSEAEWEYAARAGTNTVWFYGDDEEDLCLHGNVRDRTFRTNTNLWGGAQCLDSSYTASSVGTYEPNAFGLYDMIGNVWEWTQDCWNDTYLGAPKGGASWDQGDCNRHPIRGGSWSYNPVSSRSANRNWETANIRSSINGFRVARVIE